MSDCKLKNLKPVFEQARNLQSEIYNLKSEIIKRGFYEKAFGRDSDGE
jgi:hypothetical protein